MIALTRSSADEFWFSSAVKHAMPFSGDDDDDASDDVDDGAGSWAVVTMPAAHSQLFFGEGASSEALKGEDHTRVVVSGHEPSRQELSAETQRWLLDSFGEDVATLPPGLVRVTSDDDSSAASSAADDASSLPPRAGGVSFAPRVTIQPIPHSSELTAFQRGQMFATSAEVRRNKRRNKKEFRYDGCDWRTATEEPDMGVTLTGEEVHPVHEYCALGPGATP